MEIADGNCQDQHYDPVHHRGFDGLLPGFSCFWRNKRFAASADRNEFRCPHCRDLDDGRPFVSRSIHGPGEHAASHLTILYAASGNSWNQHDLADGVDVDRHGDQLAYTTFRFTALCYERGGTVRGVFGTGGTLGYALCSNGIGRPRPPDRSSRGGHLAAKHAKLRTAIVTTSPTLNYGESPMCSSVCGRMFNMLQPAFLKPFYLSYRALF